MVLAATLSQACANKLMLTQEAVVFHTVVFKDHNLRSEKKTRVWPVLSCFSQFLLNFPSVLEEPSVRKETVCTLNSKCVPDYVDRFFSQKHWVCWCVISLGSLWWVHWWCQHVKMLQLQNFGWKHLSEWGQWIMDSFKPPGGKQVQGSSALECQKDSERKPHINHWRTVGKFTDDRILPRL